MREGLLLGIGNPLLDLTVTDAVELLNKYELDENNAIIAAEKHLPLYGELMEKYKLDFTAGGSVQNSLRVCQWVIKKPKVCVFMGSVGQDKYSEILKQRASADGVDVRYQYQDTVPTGTCAVIVTNHNGNKRSLCANLGAAEKFTIDHIQIPENRDLVNNAEFYYISGFFLTVSPETAYEVSNLAAEKNRIFITNLSAPFICEIFKDRLMNILPYVDIFFGNETEAVTFAEQQNYGTTDLKEIAVKILNIPKINDKRKRIVILTQGCLPVLLAKDDVVTEFPVPHIEKNEIVDTNGAGDAFVGGFLSQLIQGQSLEKCIDCAIYAAGHVIKHSGCSFDTTANYTG